MRALPRWAPWRRERRKDKITKRPTRSTRFPERWLLFVAALEELKRTSADGLGFCVTQLAGYIFVDLDRCLDEAGAASAFARSVVDRLGGYWEISPSGRGLRGVVRGSLERDWANYELGIELYGGSGARYVTMTGRVFEGRATIAEVDAAVLAELEAAHAKVRAEAAEVISLDVPELVDELLLPSLEGLELPQDARAFLELGEHEGDRSGALWRATIALYAAGFDHPVVFSLLRANPFAWEVALDHRQQDDDRAELYLWREMCLKAAPVGKGAVASPEEFEELAELGPSDAMPRLRRSTKRGYDANMLNLVRALEAHHWGGFEVAYDCFRDEVLIREGRGERRPITDADHNEMRYAFEAKGFVTIGREVMRDAVDTVARRSVVDAAQEWLAGLGWDGVERVSRFLVDYFGVVDSPYARAVSDYLWTELAGRVIEPGCKADMSVALIGIQGVKKTTAVSAIAPFRRWFTEVSFHDSEADAARKMRGCVVGELPELAGFKKKEIEQSRAFLSRTHEIWVPKYKELAISYPRRIALIATTNEQEFLVDHAGNRRWLPVRCERAVDIDAIRRDRDQLWAEAAVLFTVGGVAWREAERLAPAVHEEHIERDEWDDAILEWLYEPGLDGVTPASREFLRIREVAMGALKIEIGRADKRVERRIAQCLIRIGYRRVLKKIAGSPVRVWVRG